MFLLLHGVGGTPQTMAALAQALTAEYPHALLVSVAAPLPYDGGGAGRQWFSVAGITEDNRPQRVAAALPGFVATVRELQAQHAMPWQRTALVGFSQGAIMALESTQQPSRPLAASRVISIAGRFARPPRHAPMGVVVNLMHGDQDRVMPVDIAVEADRQLRTLGALSTLDRFAGLGHGIDARVVEAIARRMSQAQEADGS
jgi:phospholipase/carboxylesterase